MSLVELLLGLALISIASAIVLPVAGELLSSARTAGAARAVAADFSALRWRATATQTRRGFFFEEDGGGWRWSEVVDGNGNGLRTAEVRSGVDPTVGPARRVPGEGVSLGFPGDGPFRRIPPATGSIPALDDPVKFGPANIVSFGPRGTATSGTLYVTDRRHELYGIRVYGPTGRLRVWRWHTRRGEWVR